MRKLCAVKPCGWEWSPLERHGGFEIVCTGDIEPQEEDFAVPLACSFGSIAVMASDISPSLITGE